MLNCPPTSYTLKGNVAGWLAGWLVGCGPSLYLSKGNVYLRVQPTRATREKDKRM